MTQIKFSVLLTGILLMLSTARETWAKSAGEYYHSGAAMYIEGRNQQAKIEVEEGLRNFPGDEKLSALAAQLKALEDQQQQQSQQNQGEGEQNPEEENQDPEQQNPEEQQPEQAGQDSTEQNQEGQGEEEDNPDSTREALAQPEPQEGEMSEEEARRLLDAYKNDEKEEQKNVNKRRGKKGRPAQDW